MKNNWRGFIGSNGQKEKETTWLIIIFVVCVILSAFSFYVAQFECALLYGFAAIVFLILAIIE